MSDRLETLIRNNRKEFDQFEVPEKLWGKIDEQLAEREKKLRGKERVIRLKVLFKAAAVIVVAGMAGLLYVSRITKNTPNIANIDPELAKQQVHYSSLIEDKREKLVQIKDQEPELYKEFNGELKKLDANYNKLKSGLSTSPNQEATVKAMIRNLKAQAEVLNQQLRVIRQLNQLKKGQQNENQSI